MKKKIININVSAKKADVITAKADLAVIGVFEGSLKNNKTAAKFDSVLKGALERVYKLADFKGKKISSAIVYNDQPKATQRIAIIGLGEEKKFDLDILRKAATLSGKIAVDLKCANVNLAIAADIDTKKFDAFNVGKTIAEGATFGAYRYDEFISSKENGRPESIKFTIVDSDSAKANQLTKGAKQGGIIATAQNIARTLANRPANYIYPETLAAEAKKIAAKTAGLTCTIFNQKQLEQKKMGGILAVGQGSEHKPCMIVLRYNPKNAKKLKQAPVALVGKAITFDTGGISLKPASGMDAMKMDMSGGAAVLCAMKAIAELKLPVSVMAVICSAENSPSGKSYRPGDIITTYSGKTVEVLNTDAEGRVVLSDGVHYAKEQGAKTIIDICTLTGACMVALGMHKAGLMGNDQKLIDDIRAASANCGEPVWHLPSGDEYADEIKSKVADLQNINTSRYGGACTGAAFIGQFAQDASWAHIDMAPMSNASEPLSKISTGGSVGFGVRIFVELISSLCR